MEIRYYPYEDLVMKSKAENIQLKTPWIELNLKFDPAVVSQLQGIYDNFKKEVLKPEEILRFSQFLQQLKAYPIYYILPFIKAGDDYEVEDQVFSDGSLATIVNVLCVSKDMAQEGFEKGNKKEIIKTLESRQSGWDHDSVLNFAKITNGYCPESVFSAVRKYHMMEVQERSDLDQVYGEIRKLSPDEQKKVAALLIRQHQYVTSRSVEALEPALEIAMSSKKELEDYINAQRGHEIIMAKAIEATGFKVEELFVGMNTKIMVDLLKFAASRNFLAFALLIDFFQGNHFSDKNPLCELLEDIGLQDSARLVGHHLENNRKSENESVTLNLLENVGLVDEAYLREALAIAELTSVFSNGLAKQVFQNYREGNV